LNFGFLDSRFKITFPEEIEGTLNDLVGLDKIKDNIYSIKSMLQYNNHNKSFNILFSGPPGTGKTKMAAYLAKELNIPLISGTGNVETGIIAGGSNIIKSLFKSAETIAKSIDGKCMIFLDEAQTLLLKRNRTNNQNKYEDDATNELLSNLDGINTKNTQIIFIAASNFDDSNFQMDSAIERRFQQKLFFDLPTIDERLKYINILIKNFEFKNIDAEYLSEITSNFSHAKLELIFKESLLHSHYDISKIDTNFIVKQFEILTIGHTSKKINNKKEKERLLIIRHELGHFFCYLELLAQKYNYNIDKIISNLKILKISSERISKYNVLGYVINIEDDDNLKSLKDLENEIIHLYGGVAAEETFYKEKDITIGSYNDIEKVTDILNLLVNKLNVYNKSKINFNKLYSHNVILKENKEQIVSKSEELYNISLNIIKKHKKNIELLEKIMLEKWILTKIDIIDLLKNNKIILKKD